MGGATKARRGAPAGPLLRLRLKLKSSIEPTTTSARPKVIAGRAGRPPCQPIDPRTRRRRSHVNRRWGGDGATYTAGGGGGGGAHAERGRASTARPHMRTAKDMTPARKLTSIKFASMSLR